MFQTDDTIVAIATPPGRGGLGVVRISGRDALACAQRLTGLSSLQPRRATLARVSGAETFDQAVVTWFEAPASYTGEHVVEISAHGSPVLLQSIVQRAMDAGARLAQPGEFTLRAYLSGRIDLVQAEAVADLIEAVTPLQARMAFDQLEGTLTERIRRIDAELFDLTARLEASLDFPDEGYHFVDPGTAVANIERVVAAIGSLLDQASAGRMIRDGLHVVIAGRPNVGKSTLFNALAGAERAIVTDIPGTTRDMLTELVDINGVPVTLVDTAGVRPEASDPVEAHGIQRARAALGSADLALVLLDGSSPLTGADRELLALTETQPRVMVITKADRPSAWGLADGGAVRVSAVAGTGLAELREAITARAAEGGDWHRDPPAVTNVRHIELLRSAKTALERARDAAAVSTPEEFVMADLGEAKARLEEITGRRTPDDTLRAIFEKFCIGK